MTDALDTAQQDHADQNSNNNAENEIEGCGAAGFHYAKADEGGIDGSDDGIDLCGVTGAEYSKDTEDGEEHAQPFPLLAQAVLDIIHGAADPVAVFILLAVVDGQRNLAVLGHHTQQGGDPHPENSAGTADGDSARHTGDIAGADGSCQGGADRLKRGDGAATSLGGAMEQLTDGILPHGAELAELEETGADTEVQTHAEDEHHGGHTPHDAIDGRIDTADGFKHLRYFLSLHNFYGICAGKGIKNAPAPALRHKDESEKRLRGTTLLRSALAGGSLMGAKDTLPL